MKHTIKEYQLSINMKDTIDEGFFDFFFDLGAKKKCPAGEAIERKTSL
ncbi:MAG: hypothetical protein WCL18_08770 [bacterium]